MPTEVSGYSATHVSIPFIKEIFGYTVKLIMKCLITNIKL